VGRDRERNYDIKRERLQFPPRSFFPRIPSTVPLCFESPPLEPTLAH